LVLDCRNVSRVDAAAAGIHSAARKVTAHRTIRAVAEQRSGLAPERLAKILEPAHQVGG